MYDRSTTDSPVVLEGSPSNATFFVDALCAGNTTLPWFPDVEVDEPPAELVALCHRCPVREQCLQQALAFDAVGIWAGTTTRQRRGIARSSSAALHEGPGSSTHYRRGCRCRECKDAQAARIREQRYRRQGAVR